MDELVHHCLRELAFDGDLGCDASRLKDFVHDFFAHNHTSHAQNLDDSFCAYVWSLVVRQPTVLVGVVPHGTTSEVWIAPQTSAKRKAKARGEDEVTKNPPKLDSIPELKTTPLDILRGTYGNRLRIAVEPDTIFEAITGSHIRPPKLTPMVYSCLQIITRGRDNGVTVVELGKKSGYDQKTCFYLVQQLTSLNLIMKVRRGGVGTHFCIHKYFFERSSSWKEIREEESQAETIHVKAVNDDVEYGEEDDDVDDIAALDFTPIDARHLSSLPLISARVIRLLKASKNNIHASTNMLITLGFSNPTKTDRRFFQSRIREMVQQGLVEKVIVPSNKKKSQSKSVKCFRLVKQSSTPADSGLVLSDPDEDMDDIPLELQNGIKLNTTLIKQIINHLQDSGTTGMTLNELSTALCEFDKRTIELLLNRADKFHPPPHLHDLRIASLMETSGRERRHRYFTVANYHKLVAQESLDKGSAGYEDVDLNNVGGFLPLHQDLFYEEEEESIQFSNAFKNGEKIRVLKGKKPRKNPLLADGTVKRGRPRKKKEEDVEEAQKPSIKSKKRKAVSPPNEEEPNGRKPAKRICRNKNQEECVVAPATLPSSPSEAILAEDPPKRKRGRPRKSVRGDVESTVVTERVISTQENDDEALSTPLDTPDGGQSTEVEPEAEPPALDSGCTSVAQSKPPIHDAVLPTPEDDIQTDHASPVSAKDSSSAMLMDVSVAAQAVESNDHTQEISPNNASASKITLPPAVASSAPGSASSRVNVSQLRRENELLKLVENAGGIVNIQTKDFYRLHMELLEALNQSGEATSAPVGTKTDKRTVTATYNSLESKGKVKQLRTSVTTLTGISRPACIIYLPHVEQARVNAFLTELAKASQTPASHLSSFVKIENRLEYGADSSSTIRGIPPLQLLQSEKPGDNEKERWSKNLDRAQQLFNHDDATVREVFLAERTTMAQVYGYIVGKALRCRQLHLSTMDAFESQSNSSYIISHEKRILDISFFFNDLSIKTYCSLISPLSYDEELAGFMASNEGTLVRDLPQSLQASLQLGKSRSRSRFLDMLDILRSLRIATPLQPSTSDDPFIVCQKKGEYPTAFDKASLDGWSTNTPMFAPTYWHFHDCAPIFLFYQSETEPPYWKSRDVDTQPNILAYWDDLQEACTNPQIMPDFGISRQSEVCTSSLAAARSLRRAVSWKSEYFLTWHQSQYLKQFIDNSSMSTPLQIPDETERLNQLRRICWVTSAPWDVITGYFSSTREKLVKNSERQKEKAKRSQRRAAETKLSLAKKAEEARLQREQEWSGLLSRLHPEQLESSASLRIDRIRTQFVQSGAIKDVSKWEKDIQAALHEADLASTKGLKITSKRPVPIRQPVTQPPLVTSAQDTPSISRLIELQGPSTQPKAKVKRKRKKDSSEVPTDSHGNKRPVRRHRFHWNPEFDELARDASAIIRARCRHLPRLDWGAFEQVFPSVPRNTVRQRLAHIKETPGNEAYLRRLEDSWYDIWLKYRGTDHLPDEDFQSATKFDLVKHVEFLRSHVDKNAIRVGLGHAKETPGVALPSSVDALLHNFEVGQAEKVAPDWDFMWNALIEEGREKRLKKTVLSRSPEEFPALFSSETDEIILAEAIVKMVMGSPPETYDPEQASSLLKSKGNEVVDIATKNLLSRGILSKSHRDPLKQKPGRQLKISEVNQNAISGSISRDTFQDAVSLLEEIDANDDSWHEWPLTATDGDCATLMELVSDGKVDFNIDTSQAQAARLALDWNSKKADDDQIETAISVRYRLGADKVGVENDTQANESVHTEPQMLTPASAEVRHGINSENNAACCRLLTGQGCVDCKACLDDAYANLFDPQDQDNQRASQWVLDVVRQRKETGVKKAELAAMMEAHRPGMALIVTRMVDANTPLAYWIGYNTLRLVAADYVSKWTLAVSTEPVLHVFPRRWLDIRGISVPDFWQAALRAVMGVIIFRPGIPQAEIRWRLRAVYDRQEINEVLRYLMREGYLQVRIGFPTIWTGEGAYTPFDEDEERKVYWFVNNGGDKEWYQV
ncbi:hypothetical protein CPC08DRAFT_14379 [Agrocybe pediades]|nr:hypothetical protein CPC08DRAFT_14379 [Agrocybe pediades]